MQYLGLYPALSKYIRPGHCSIAAVGMIDNFTVLCDHFKSYISKWSQLTGLATNFLWWLEQEANRPAPDLAVVASLMGFMASFSHAGAPAH